MLASNTHAIDLGFTKVNACVLHQCHLYTSKCSHRLTPILLHCLYPQDPPRKPQDLDIEQVLVAPLGESTPQPHLFVSF